MADSSKKSQLRDLARGVVLAQGNLFIKELLRAKGLPIGTTKADFTAHMLEAIDSGALTEADFETWLQRVEGWGDQHIYLYRWRPPEGDGWDDPAWVRQRVKTAGLLEAWEASSSLAFPEQLALTGVYFKDRRLRLVWHQGSQSMVRDTSKDYEEFIDGDRYEFRAYRERSERAVMRFDLRGDEGIAGAFVQVPVSSDAHRPALDKMMATVEKVLSAGAIKLLDVARIIRRLDQAQLQKGTSFSTQVARWSGAGAYVEFGADSPSGNYRDVEAIRELRLAMRPSITGATAKMTFEAPGDEGPARQVKAQLYARDHRIWLGAQMAEGQVWALLDLIRSA